MRAKAVRFDGGGGEEAEGEGGGWDRPGWRRGTVEHEKARGWQRIEDGGKGVRYEVRRERENMASLRDDGGLKRGRRRRRRKADLEPSSSPPFGPPSRRTSANFFPLPSLGCRRSSGSSPRHRRSSTRSLRLKSSSASRTMKLTSFPVDFPSFSRPPSNSASSRFTAV